MAFCFDDDKSKLTIETEIISKTFGAIASGDYETVRIDFPEDAVKMVGLLGYGALSVNNLVFESIEYDDTDGWFNVRIRNKGTSASSSDNNAWLVVTYLK